MLWSNRWADTYSLARREGESWARRGQERGKGRKLVSQTKGFKVFVQCLIRQAVVHILSDTTTPTGDETKPDGQHSEAQADHAGWYKNSREVMSGGGMFYNLDNNFSDPSLNHCAIFRWFFSPPHDPKLTTVHFVWCSEVSGKITQLW